MEAGRERARIYTCTSGSSTSKRLRGLSFVPACLPACLPICLLVGICRQSISGGQDLGTHSKRRGVAWVAQVLAPIARCGC